MVFKNLSLGGFYNPALKVKLRAGFAIILKSTEKAPSSKLLVSGDGEHWILSIITLKLILP